MITFGAACGLIPFRSLFYIRPEDDERLLSFVLVLQVPLTFLHKSCEIKKGGVVASIRFTANASK